MLIFSDFACSGDKLIGSEVYGMGCAMRVQDSYYSADSAYSTSLRCLPQSSDPALRYIPPSPSADASYAMQRYCTAMTISPSNRTIHAISCSLSVYLSICLSLITYACTASFSS